MTVLNNYKSIIEECMSEARRATTHPAKLAVLTKLLMKVFGVRLTDLIPGIEKKVGNRILGFRGSTDLLFRTVIFEIKVDLEREIEDAEQKLKKYFQALYEAESERRHISIATDVIKFKAYHPIIRSGQIADIKKIGSIDISKANIEETILWLDSYVFSKPKIRPTTDDLKFRFGPESPTYSLTIDTLKGLWEAVRAESSVKLKLDLWAKNMEIVYGSSPKEEAFLDQTYLVTLVKLIVYYGLAETM